MRKFALTAALGAACLGLAACNQTDNANNSADANGSATGESTGSEGVDNNGTATGNGTSASAAFPKGARIVEENGVTYRVDADGTRVRLGASDSRIVVENGVRYRVDPDGTRVRIDPKGVSIDVDVPDLTPDDVDVGINKKGNLDIDVKNKKDGNSGPN
ncbi:MAG TPA: hypothetical protein VHM92_06585 [Allosphingosinicella sp.]|nr:hypothetical protein [Allosphingosinicella sp.]